MIISLKFNIERWNTNFRLIHKKGTLETYDLNINNRILQENTFSPFLFYGVLISLSIDLKTQPMDKKITSKNEQLARSKITMIIITTTTTTTIPILLLLLLLLIIIIIVKTRPIDMKLLQTKWTINSTERFKVIWKKWRRFGRCTKHCGNKWITYLVLKSHFRNPH